MTATACELCAAMDPLANDCALQRHLRPGQRRVVAHNRRAVAVPTIGAFTEGYVLVAPRRHALSVGQLDRPGAEGLQDLLDVVQDRLWNTYRRPVLVFEYGLHLPARRRIEHAHLHALPTDADLHGWLKKRLPGQPVDELAQLPEDPSTSYIFVRDQAGDAAVFPIPNDAAPRIRLRQVVASLDPHLPYDAWDWQANPYPYLMQRTVDDLDIGQVPEQVTPIKSGQVA